jgi:hypothetical protein
MNAQPPQRGAGAIDALGQLTVGDALLTALDGDFAAAAFGGVAIDEVRRGVEEVRQILHAGILADRDDGPRPAQPTRYQGGSVL